MPGKWYILAGGVAGALVPVFRRKPATPPKERSHEPS
jgi:hypothetical protein